MQFIEFNLPDNSIVVIDIISIEAVNFLDEEIQICAKSGGHFYFEIKNKLDYETLKNEKTKQIHLGYSGLSDDFFETVNDYIEYAGEQIEEYLESL